MFTPQSISGYIKHYIRSLLCNVWYCNNISLVVLRTGQLVAAERVKYKKNQGFRKLVKSNLKQNHCQIFGQIKPQVKSQGNFLDKKILKSSHTVKYLVKSSLKSSCRIKKFQVKPQVKLQGQHFGQVKPQVKSQGKKFGKFKPQVKLQDKILVKSSCDQVKSINFYWSSQVKRLAHPYCDLT